MKQYFRKLIQYNNWANSRILVNIKDHFNDDEAILKLFSHIISAQYIWLLRIKGLPTTPFPVWQIYNTNELESMTAESTENWLQYIEGHRMETFEEMIFYQNSEGKKFESTIAQIITHVVNHGTHHRGQIAMLMRQKGVAPPQNDYIFYTRQSL